MESPQQCIDLVLHGACADLLRSLQLSQLVGHSGLQVLHVSFGSGGGGCGSGSDVRRVTRR